MDEILLKEQRKQQMIDEANYRGCLEYEEFVERISRNDYYESEDVIIFLDEEN